MTERKFSHIDDKGKASMVDVGTKPIEKRSAIAEGFIKLQPETVWMIDQNEMKKGDVLTVAEVAGIQGAKRTADLIPLCHTLMLTKIKVTTELCPNGVKVTTQVNCNGQTGVEMEALNGTSVALLTIYDMCKAVDKEMVIGEISLLEKKKENIE